MIRLSIVVPMFNAERFVPDCFGTILRQGLDPADYEVVVVDDGSTDGTLAACERHADMLGGRLVVEHQENAGAGAARNHGIDVTRGEYLYFLDADDDLADGALAELLGRCERDRLDVLLFGAEVVYEDEECERLYPQDPRYFQRRVEPGVRDGADLFVAQQDDWNFCGQPCMLMARLAHVRACGARFGEGVMNEDNIYVLRATLHAKRADVEPALLYRYHVRHNTVTTRNIHGDQIFLAHLEMSQEFDEERRLMLAAGREEVADSISRLMEWFCDVLVANCPERPDRFAPFLDERFARLSLAGRYVGRAAREKRRGDDEQARAEAAEARVRELEPVAAEAPVERARAEAAEARIRELEPVAAEAPVERARAEAAEARIRELEESTAWKVGRAVTAIPRAIKRRLS